MYALFPWLYALQPVIRKYLNDCRLFILEIFLVNSQVVCIVIAALLQYFFVAMFCWAVCEGLQLFMTLTTGKNRNYTRLKYFLIIGWSK